MMTVIDAGSPAPGFTAPTNDGGSLSLDGLRGKAVVLYFYPRDDTPALHAGSPGVHRSPGRIRARRCGNRRRLQGHGRKARQVQEKYGLPFTLVSDTEGDICERYSVWVEKKNYGKTYMGTERSTFLIDADGTVSKSGAR